MNLEDIVLISELIASIAVVITLVYLAKQVRQNTRVNRAAARHSLSEFALELTKFRAEHADRWVKVNEQNDLSPGDIEFRKWNHMMLLLHAETYFHQHKLDLMPDTHWNNYTKFVIAGLDSPGFEDYWNEVGFAFSEDFSLWLNKVFEEHNIKK
ncbi:hypothetical protein [Fulvivirga sedimenti]|uniref:DUF4760 domain-containing protein n=1 Tax=Fulvivirga sedimenti TaxID=2879465 RepID=A0A9X1HM03_9BACT|nr:hypothetical protein [Fulvivirga sedimenti]MCA6073811.1 hypothetical protein [Fulvivirga sedimenti]